MSWNRGKVTVVREQRILALLNDLANGKRMKELAYTYNIHPNAVRADLYVFRQRHGLKTTHQAVAFAVRNGLVK